MTKRQHTAPRVDRRKLLIGAALAFGSVPLRSLVTGLPRSWFADLGSRAMAQANGATPKYLLMSLRAPGDPINNNAPGTYAPTGDASDFRSSLAHPTAAEAGAGAAGFEAPATFTLGAQTVTAAAPWADLDADLRQRFAFWHHGTFVGAHPEFAAVLRFNGAIRSVDGSGSEQFPTMVAEEVHGALGTVVREPISVGGSPVSVAGRPVPLLRPTDLDSLFGEASPGVERMVTLRDRFLDRAYATVRASGTPAQKRFFDRHALSKQEAVAIGDSLGSLITEVSGNTPMDQARVAVALMQLGIAPVVTLGLEFGGDSHADSNLADETTETIAGVGDLNFLWQQLKASGLQDQVVFASLNTFGRTGLRNAGGGRDHNGNHHAMMVFGPGIKGGVIGGVEGAAVRRNAGLDLKATGIHSAGDPGGAHDIPFEETLTSVGKTLARALQLPDATTEARITSGKVITGALS